jgi:hypothetical protein
VDERTAGEGTTAVVPDPATVVRGARVLLTEDDPGVAGAMSAALTHHRYDVTHEARGWPTRR